MTSKKPDQPLPLIAFGLFATPIFLINLILPAHPQSNLDMAIDHFLDNQLFGLIGFWSSLFPFSSKATANYIALFAPLLAAVSTFYAFTEKFDSTQFDQMTLRRYLILLFAGVVLSALFIWCFYLTSTDLGTTKGKYGNLFGLNVFFFSAHNVAMSLFPFLVVPFMVQRCLYYIPCRILKRWWNSREKA
jgi:hypothetical protein